MTVVTLTASISTNEQSAFGNEDLNSQEYWLNMSEEAAGRIKNREHRASALLGLARARIKFGLSGADRFVDEAREVLMKIPWSEDYYHGCLFKCLCDVYSFSGQFEKAKSQLKYINREPYRRYALGNLAGSQAEHGHWEEAIETIMRIEDPDYRESMFGSIAVDKAMSGDLKGAEILLDRVKKPLVLAVKTARIAQILAKAGNISEAKKFFYKSISIAMGSGESESKICRTLKEIVHIQVACGFADVVIKTLNRINTFSRHGIPLTLLERAAYHCKPDEVKRMSEMVKKRQRWMGSVEKTIAACMAISLIRSGELEKAEPYVREVGQYYEAFGIGYQYLAAKAWDKAEHIGRVMNCKPLGRNPIRSLCLICKARIGKGDLKGAKKALDLISDPVEDSADYANTFYSLVTTYAKAGQLTRARDLIKDIDPRTQSNVALGVARILKR